MTSEDLTQWINYLKEFNSTFTWDVKQLLDLDSSTGLGPPSIGIGFQPATWDVMSEIGFQKKRTITRKMTLVTQETQLFRPITDKQMNIGCLNSPTQSSRTNFYFHGVN